MAELVTLSGDYDLSPRYGRRNSTINRANDLEELMGRGFMDWVKDTASATVAVVVSPIKGVGHMGLEMYRGAKTGDIGRIAAAPFKGIGKIGADYGRKQYAAAEYWWRPSRMVVWQQPVGAALTAAGAVPTPLSPFLLAGGAALTISGGIAGSIYASDQASKEKDKKRKEEILRKAKEKNYMYYAAGAIGIGILAVTLM